MSVVGYFIFYFFAHNVSVFATVCGYFVYILWLLCFVVCPFNLLGHFMCLLCFFCLMEME